MNIDVDDLERGVRFYESALGLRVGRRFGKAAVEMLGGSSAIYLLLKGADSEVSSLAQQKRDYSRHWTPVHLDFVVEDVDAAIRRAEAAGAKLEKVPSVFRWGKLALMADPFGHGFCFLEFLGRGYDEIAS